MAKISVPGAGLDVRCTVTSDESAFKLVLLARVVEELEKKLLVLLHDSNDAILQVVLKLLTQEVTPENVFQFEEELAAAGRAVLRVIAEFTLNQLEPDDPDQMPKIIKWQCGEYRRENQMTSHQDVSTRFGNITLWRFPYRFRQRESESSIFPLEAPRVLCLHDASLCNVVPERSGGLGSSTAGSLGSFLRMSPHSFQRDFTSRRDTAIVQVVISKRAKWHGPFPERVVASDQNHADRM